MLWFSIFLRRSKTFQNFLYLKETAYWILWNLVPLEKNSDQNTISRHWFKFDLIINNKWNHYWKNEKRGNIFYTSRDLSRNIFCEWIIIESFWVRRNRQKQTASRGKHRDKQQTSPPHWEFNKKFLSNKNISRMKQKNSSAILGLNSRLVWISFSL